MSKQYFRVCFCFWRMFRLKVAGPPADVRNVFETYSENGKMTVDHLLRFLVDVQGEERPTKEHAQAILNSFKHLSIFQRTALSLEAFFRYLLSDQNPPLSPSRGVISIPCPLCFRSLISLLFVFLYSIILYE
ncbi:phosphoinositide phospholipase C [Sarracenia purpurea var. burkii]